jgi:hypothetical protein
MVHCNFHLLQLKSYSDVFFFLILAFDKNTDRGFRPPNFDCPCVELRDLS